MDMHQLREAPDYADALSLPLPLHLAGRTQSYVLPMLAQDSADPGAPSAPGGTESPNTARSQAPNADSDPDLFKCPAQEEGDDLLEQLTPY